MHNARLLLLYNCTFIICMQISRVYASVMPLHAKAKEFKMESKQSRISLSSRKNPLESEVYYIYICMYVLKHNSCVASMMSGVLSTRLRGLSQDNFSCVPKLLDVIFFLIFSSTLHVLIIYFIDFQCF